MGGIPDAKARREQAKKLAEERRAERRSRRRRCALCGLEEDEKSPFVAHPDGIGPTCREPGPCEQRRAAAGRAATAAPER